MHTIERSLEEHFRGRSFVILGVNCDADLQTQRKGQQRDQTNWRSIHDGNGVNMERWQVNRTPTLILVDARGMIRYRSLSLPSQKDLEQQIEKLLEEVPTGEKAVVALGTPGR